MIHEAGMIAEDGDTLDLDPFAFWPDLQSRLMGLGGAEQSDDPDYVFHTRYATCGTGPILFTVAMDGLQASRGTLILRVHELPEVMGASARQVAISQTQLIDLMRSGGEVMLAADAQTGSNYAILGHIYGDTVATADALHIEVARRSPDPDHANTLTRFRSAPNRTAAAAQLIGQQQGTLAAPMSQLCTLSQCREPVYRSWAKHFGAAATPPSLDLWECVYIARVLDRYEVSRPGARGLGIGGLGGPLAEALAAAGPRLLLTSPGEPRPDVPLPPGAAACRLDPYAVDGLEGFDFAYATRTGGVGGADRQLLQRFIEDVLRTLKPGGLLVVTVSVDVAPRPIGDDRGSMIRRPDLDRLALLLISRGHQVAQLLPFGEAIGEADETDSVVVSAFGLVVRKAT